MEVEILDATSNWCWHIYNELINYNYSWFRILILMHWGGWGFYWTARCCAMKDIWGLSGGSDCLLTPSYYLKTILQDGPCCKSGRHKPVAGRSVLSLWIRRLAESRGITSGFFLSLREIDWNAALFRTFIAQQQQITLEELAGRSFCRPSKARRGPCMLSMSCMIQPSVPNLSTYRISLLSATTFYSFSMFQQISAICFAG